MSKLPNIIQRRELEPLLLKAHTIVKHYEKAANCAAYVMEPGNDTSHNACYSLCGRCKEKAVKKSCYQMHMEAVNEAKILGGSHVYICPSKLTFWTSPFYSGERFAGAFLSGGIKKSEKNKNKVKALANIMLIYANQISSISFTQKNISPLAKHPSQLEKSKYISSAGSFAARETSLHDASAITAQLPAETDSLTEKSLNDNCSISMERMLLANLRRGDNTEAGKILQKLLNTLYCEVKGNFQVFRLKALELAVLLSRATFDPNDINDAALCETNDRYLKKIEKSSAFREILETLSCFTEKISVKIFSFHGVRHYPALRKAERFIWDNFTRKLSLQEIANVSGLSAPYFSTIFKEEMGENLSDYLNRLRVEKAAAMLITTNTSIRKIAKTCGFEDQSWFSKIFKNNTGLTPGKYREQGCISGLSA